MSEAVEHRINSTMTLYQVNILGVQEKKNQEKKKIFQIYLGPI